MKKIFITALIFTMIIGAFNFTSCGSDPLDEFLDELHEKGSYQMDIKAFGGYGSVSNSTAYEGDKILNVGPLGTKVYIEKSGDKYYKYYKAATNDWVKEEFTGDTSAFWIDSSYLDFASYEEADEEPNTYKFKSKVKIEGIAVSEVRASLRDGKLVITAPSDSENGAITQITIHSVGLAKVSIPEVK